MKILVTGVAGFIGSHAAERLINLGHEVIGIDSFSSFYNVRFKNANAEQLARQGVTILKGDLADPATYRFLPTNFDYIFHFAAQCGLSSSIEPEEYIKHNILATKHLLTFALSNTTLQLFIHISSSSVYGKEALANEESISQPISSYGATKLAAEQLVLSCFRSECLPVSVLRLYSVYGPRERTDKLFTRLIYAGLSGSPFTLFKGSENHIRSFTYVDDIIDGIVQVMENSKACNGEIINLGNDTAHSTQDGIALVEHLLSKKLQLKILPPRVGDQISTRAVIDKAKRLLNYTPSRSLSDGLQQQVFWHLENINRL
ncbi:nucleoside-diphosphate-sugar epimerase [Pedobacter sp. AK017]|uniref:NAD-dependent epimerase/dehydratase family protein n=1 Tax=Pedobacter sp. AK017 TaxID=2723073 RepID=UPI00161C827B|nr:NAD-dependent epimerase/dehydratase family protein [Pedobacter sp. AK017]MBB5441224.1 nucleoside-diphosphate-sugar epimerase [Pedobacter sp. AK017]